MGLLRYTPRPPSPTRKNLGTAYQENPNQPQPPPLPPSPASSPASLTTARLKDTLLLVDVTLRRQTQPTPYKLPPSTLHRLARYKLALNLALTLDALPDSPAKSAKKLDLSTAIIDFETSFFDQVTIANHPNTVQPLAALRSPSLYITRLTQLARHEYACTYGKYAQLLCQEMGIPLADAPECRVEHFEAIPGWNTFWSTVHSEMQHMKRNYPYHWGELEAAQLSPFTESELDTDDGGGTISPMMGIIRTSNLAGRELGDTARMIARRELWGCQDVLYYVENGEWEKLKEILHSDLLDMPRFVEPGQKGVIPALREIIEAVVDRYFYRDGGDPYDVEKWTVRGKAVTKGREFQEVRRELVDRAEGREEKAEAEVEVLGEEVEVVRVERTAVVHRAMELWGRGVSTRCVAAGGRRTYRRMRVDFGEEGVWEVVKGVGGELREEEPVDAVAWMCLVDDERGRLPSWF